MALVAEAVNHFFHPSHSPVEQVEQSHPPRTPRTVSSGNTPKAERLRESSQPRVPMPSTSSRVASESKPHRADPEQAVNSEEEDSTVSARDTPVKSEGAPPSPSLEAQSKDASSDVIVPQPRESTDNASEPSPTPPMSAASGSETPQRIEVKSLAHIQALATADGNNDLGKQTRGGIAPQYSISGMPIENILEMVAGLLTKITTANDVQHEHLHRQMPPPDNSANISPQTSSVLAFHGKNVPSITILSYLSRINKYCPTSYEVFLSLLVYFDRMTEKVNSGPIQSLREASSQSLQSQERKNEPDVQSRMEDVRPTAVSQTPTPPGSGDIGKQPKPTTTPGTPHSRSIGGETPPPQSQQGDSELNLSHFFVVDSFNIHRLVIAGVTCASKFFSDVFYTNSRYAKVGGLPLPELNHLELQFLLLNDFRLAVPVEELEAYGTMLVEFYAREVLSQSEGLQESPSQVTDPVPAAG